VQVDDAFYIGRHLWHFGDLLHANNFSHDGDISDVVLVGQSHRDELIGIRGLVFAGIVGGFVSHIEY